MLVWLKTDLENYMNKDMANFSADLRRVALWIYKGQSNLALEVLELAKKKYSNIPVKIACYDNIWQEVEKIAKLEGGVKQSSERALTASVILLNSV